MKTCRMQMYAIYTRKLCDRNIKGLYYKKEPCNIDFRNIKGSYHKKEKVLDKPRKPLDGVGYAHHL
jgi:hypothetical protein